MSVSDREKWNSKYSAGTPKPAAPPEWLARHLAIAPRGSALDVATGRGAAAMELASHGLARHCPGRFDVGIRSAATQARGLGKQIDWIVADLDTFPLPVARFDLITTFYFLDRYRLPTQTRPSVAARRHIDLRDLYGPPITDPR